MPRNGSATSSKPATSRPATLTSEASLTCDRTICAATSNAISSPVSAAGRSHSVSPDGPTTDLFGQALAHVSRSAPPERARRPMTSATCGLRGFLSSPSAALQSSLESRLKRQLDGAGSTLFSLTWKRKATPAGRPYYQLVASADPTSGSDFGSWPTATANENIGDLNKKAERRAKMKEKWKGISGNGFGHSMAEIAQMAAWPTPMAGTPAQRGYNEAGNTDSARKTVALAGWRSPAAQNGERGGQDGLERIKAGHTLNLQDQAMLAAWSTPRANKWGFPDAHGSQEQPLASGPMPTGSTAQTESAGQLDPDHSRWVMGYSAGHLNCAPTETPSFLKSRQNLSWPLHPKKSALPLNLRNSP